MKPQPSAQTASNAHLRPRRPGVGARLGWTAWTVFLALVAAGLLTLLPPVLAADLPAAVPNAAPNPAPNAAGHSEARSAALLRATDAVIGLQVMALDDARSAATLGRARSGSGVVISADGLVLTIG